MNSTTMYPLSILHHPCFFFTVSQHQSNHPEQLRENVRIAKKTPCNYLPFWHNISQCIKTGMGYCSNISAFNLYSQKLFWKTRTLNSQISPGEKPSHPMTTRKTKNKTLQHSWKNEATPNYKMKQRASSPHNTALEGRMPAGCIYRRPKFLIKVLCTLSHNSGTGITQPATVILHVQ